MQRESQAMISVIEGPSAVGKTTLAQSLPPRQVVMEDWDALGFPRASWPDLETPEGQVFGVELCAHRWAVMRRVEEQFGAAYGDTDPLKLYYDFALALYGHKTLAAFHAICERIAEAMREERLGFADRVLFLTASPMTLTARKQADPTRQRRNFALHLSISPGFARYYEILGSLRPGSVTVLDADHDVHARALAWLRQEQLSPHKRYDLNSFAQLREELMRELRTNGLGR